MAMIEPEGVPMSLRVVPMSLRVVPMSLHRITTHSWCHGASNGECMVSAFCLKRLYCLNQITLLKAGPQEALVLVRAQ